MYNDKKKMGGKKRKDMLKRQKCEHVPHKSNIYKINSAWNNAEYH